MMGVTMSKISLLILIIFLLAFSAPDYSYSENKQRDCTIILDESLEEGPTAAWLAYALKRVLWYRETFFEEFPNEGNYRYTFQEEIESRKNLAQVWLELCQNDPSFHDKYLDELVIIYQNGYLNEYVSLYFDHIDWKVDKDKLRMNDFMKWANENISQHKPETSAIVSPAPE